MMSPPSRKQNIKIHGAKSLEPPLCGRTPPQKHKRDTKITFVYFFQMPVSKIDMDVIARLPDHIAQFQYLIIAHQLSAIHNPSLPICGFCGLFCDLCGYFSYTFD